MFQLFQLFRSVFRVLEDAVLFGFCRCCFFPADVANQLFLLLSFQNLTDAKDFLKNHGLDDALIRRGQQSYFIFHFLKSEILKYLSRKYKLFDEFYTFNIVMCTVNKFSFHTFP